MLALGPPSPMLRRLDQEFSAKGLLVQSSGAKGNGFAAMEWQWTSETPNSYRQATSLRQVVRPYLYLALQIKARQGMA